MAESKKYALDEGFEEVVELDEGFEEVSEPADVSKLESFLRGAGQGATFGFQDEASARTQPLVNYLLDKFNVGKMIAGQNVGDTDTSTYEERRDQFRKENREAQEANPGTYLAGEVAGGVTTTAPLMVAGGAPSAGKLIAAGTAAGGASGAGYSEEEDVLGIAKDALLGAGTGAAFSAAGSAAGKAGNKLAEYTGRGFKKGFDKASRMLYRGAKALENAADELAAKNIELKSSTINRIGLDKVRKIGRQLIDDGVATRPMRAKTYLRTVAASKKKTGKELAELYKVADSKGEKLMNPKELTRSVVNFLKTSDEFADPRQLRTAQRELENILANKSDDIGMSHTEVWNLAKDIEGKINKWNRTTDPRAHSKADTLDKAASFIRKQLSEGIDALPNSGDLAKEIKGVSQVYSNLSFAEKGLQGKVQDAFGRRLPMEVNKAGMIDRATSGTPIRSTLTKAADSTSKGMKSLSEVLRSNPTKMGKYAKVLERQAQRGGNAMASTHYVLMQKDPEYRKKYTEVTQDE